MPRVRADSGDLPPALFRPITMRRMRSSRCDEAVRRPSRMKNTRQIVPGSYRGGGGGGSRRLIMVAILIVLVAALTPDLTSAREEIPTQEGDGASYVAGTTLLEWWGQRGDVASAVTRLSGVQQCPETVNALVDRELLRSEDDLLAFCMRDAVDYDLLTVLRSSEELVGPSSMQTMRLCGSEACTTWLSKAAKATWLSECHYRQSQTSVRSLAETLLRIGEDLAVDTVDVTILPPNASTFLELYQLNQLKNMLDSKTVEADEIETPSMQIARQLAPQTDFAAVDGDGSLQISEAADVEETGASSVGSDADAEAGASNSTSTSDSDSLGSSEEGPHAESTPTTTELATSYLYVTGAWVLFNGSYLFLMRKR